MESVKDELGLRNAYISSASSPTDLCAGNANKEKPFPTTGFTIRIIIITGKSAPDRKTLICTHNSSSTSSSCVVNLEIHPLERYLR